MTDDRENLIEDKRILAEAINNENNVINQRMGWALTLQGFLFASYFLADPEQTGQAQTAIAVLGFAASVSSFIGSFFGNLALTRAIRGFERVQEKLGSGRDVKPGARFWFAPTILMPHLFIPLALIGVWGFVLIEPHLISSSH